ncbi:MAG: iron uptake porin [Pleurocapsa sp.]
MRSLVERYGCVGGFPNQTFRGKQALSRYEFAAGLNSCLQQIERLITSSESIRQEDLATANKLTQEFAAELAAIRGRVDNVESRLGFLEDHQFSTTTIFNGEVIFAIADAWGGNPPGGCRFLPDGDDLNNEEPEVDCTNPAEPSTNTVLAYLMRLGLQTSFTGQDRLRMFLTTGNFGFGDSEQVGGSGGFTNPRSLNTYMARLSYQADLNNKTFLDLLEYRFPVFDDRVVVTAIPFGFNLSSVLTSNSPYFDIGRGSISRFGQLSPIYRIGGAMDSGIGFDWQIAKPVRLQLAYGTRDSGDPDQGFFGANHSALGAQLLLQPTENIVTGITWVNSYARDGVLGTFTGSVNAETGGLWREFALVTDSDDSIPDDFECPPDKNFCKKPFGDQPAQINAVGGTLQWRLTDDLTFGAWGGYFFSKFRNKLPEDPNFGTSAGKTPFANVATFAMSLGLSDAFGREGDLFGFIFGMPPKLIDAGPETKGWPVPFFEQTIANEDISVVTDNNPNIRDGPSQVGFKDEATSLHFEFFYRLKATDNISITPGFLFVTNPGHIAENDTIYVGTVRTTFRF